MRLVSVTAPTRIGSSRTEWAIGIRDSGLFAACRCSLGRPANYVNIFIYCSTREVSNEGVVVPLHGKPEKNGAAQRSNKTTYCNYGRVRKHYVSPLALSRARFSLSALSPADVF